MDLLGRKVVAKNGKALMLYIEEVKKSIEEAKKYPDIKTYAEELEQAFALLQDVTATVTSLAIKGEIEIFLADATLYLEFFSIICIAWQWLIQAIAAQKALDSKPSEADEHFYKGKLHTFRFFFEYELPKTAGLAKRLKKGDGLTVQMRPEFFDD
jgi:butyryl-CoA dehydrogenase